MYNENKTTIIKRVYTLPENKLCPVCNHSLSVIGKKIKKNNSK